MVVAQEQDRIYADAEKAAQLRQKLNDDVSKISTWCPKRVGCSCGFEDLHEGEYSYCCGGTGEAASRQIAVWPTLPKTRMGLSAVEDLGRNARHLNFDTALGAIGYGAKKSGTLAQQVYEQETGSFCVAGQLYARLLNIDDEAKFNPARFLFHDEEWKGMHNVPGSSSFKKYLRQWCPLYQNYIRPMADSVPPQYKIQIGKKARLSGKNKVVRLNTSVGAKGICFHTASRFLTVGLSQALSDGAQVFIMSFFKLGVIRICDIGHPTISLAGAMRSTGICCVMEALVLYEYRLLSSLCSRILFCRAWRSVKLAWFRASMLVPF